MAINTYSTLKTAIADWIERDDLTDQIPDFITLAESRITRNLQHWRMEKRATTSTTAGDRTISIPNDYIAMRALKLNTDPQDVLEFVPPSVLYEGSASQGRPRWYTIQGNQIVLEPIPDSAYAVEIGYYAFDKLSTSNPSNWLLTYYPDAYLYGSLLQAEAFMMNDPRIPLWEAAFTKVLDEINKNDKDARWNGTPLIIRAQP